MNHLTIYKAYIAHQKEPIYIFSNESNNFHKFNKFMKNFKMLK